MHPDFAYDKVRYPAQVYPKLHPSRLAAIARLHGVPVASPRACRVLEVGCGDGLTLITQAMAYPDSRFVGIDLSQAAIARGNATREQLGLDNLTLLDADLLGWDPGADTFDFVVAHGFYSWVPQVVRERLLALCEQALAPSGIACISYNALPGCHMRRMLWEMLKFHSEGIEDPARRVETAQEFLDLLRSGLPETGLYATTMVGEITDLVERLDPNVLFHDDLAEINDPCTLDQFVRHAGTHGLSFVAEANYHEMSPRTAHERVRPLLEQMARDDIVAKEQYLDFFTGRRFRQTLLCRREAKPSPLLDPTVVGTLELASDLQPDPAGPDETGRMRFSLKSSGSVVTDNPVVQRLLTTCADLYPQPRSVAALADAAIAATPDAGDHASELDKIRQFFARAFEVGIVELHCDAPRFADHASTRPSASPLARLQVEAGEPAVTTLRPSTLGLEDPVSRQLLLALDGSRDRAATLEFLASAMGRLRAQGHAAASSLPGIAELDAHLDANLAKVARLGLLLQDGA